MRWWIRSHRPVWAAGAVLLGTVAVIVAPDSFGLPIPSLAGPTAFAAVRLHALVAVLISVGVWVSVSAGHKSAVLAATRWMKLYVFALICSVVAVCGVLVGAWATFASDRATPALLLLRDSLGLLGLGMALVPFTGYRFVGVVSTVYVFISAIFGRTSQSDAALWAWPISDSPGIQFWLPAMGLFVLGSALWISRANGRYSRVMIAQAMDTRRE